MIAFEQAYFPWIKSSFEWKTEDDLGYRFSSPNKRFNCTFPLASLHPEPLVFKRTSRIAGIIILIVLGAMFVFAHDYVTEPTSWNNNIWSFMLAEFFLAMIAIGSGLYYLNSRRERILFHLKDSQAIAFELLNTPDNKLNHFKEELGVKILHATIRYDENNIAVLKRDIPRLYQEKIISNEFESILYERLSE